MHIFFKPGVQAGEIQLNEEESKHCIRVLRMRLNDTVHLVDGAGGYYYARITDPNPKNCSLAVYQSFKEFKRRDYRLTIAIAPTKNIERFEWFLEKATEIGVDRIIPVVCKQSERQIIKPERLIKILIEAIKQSGQAYLPQLQELTGFDNFIKQNTDDKMLIAFCTEDQKRLLKSVINPGENITILIGPEGDFTREEIKVAFDSGYTGISLGQNRLRTETAGVVAAHTVALVNQLG